MTTKILRIFINRSPHLFGTIIFLSSVAAGCATSQNQPNTLDQGFDLSQPTRQSQPSPPRLNKVQMAKRIGLFRDQTEVGFRQSSFNDCTLPRDLRKNHRCSTQYLSLINFRMRCRDSEGTVDEQVSNYELTPLRSRHIKWEVGSLNGKTQTDSRGYGQVIVRSWAPIESQQFRLTANGHIMGVPVKQVRQFVLPKYWCD